MTSSPDATSKPTPGAVAQFILDHVAGLTFCDIGGIGLNAMNERVSVALDGGATEATMIDFRREGFPEWDAFRAKMQGAGLSSYKTIAGANLEHESFPDTVGSYDFVHSTGILYHAPAPLRVLDNLARITRRFLITNTIIAPDVMETDAGRLEFPGSQIVFLPGISEQERSVMELYYQKLLGWPAGRFSAFVPRIGDKQAAMPWLQTRAASPAHYWGAHGDLSFSPYWWLFTKDAFRAAVKLFGFEIRQEHSFKGHTLSVFCEKIPAPPPA